MQAPVVVQRAVREVGPDRSDRRAKAGTDTVAGGEIGANARVPGVARVDEGSHAPGLADPARVLDAADEEASSADDGARLRHADALERIAAHRLVAAGAEEEGARNPGARLRAHGTRLPAEQQVVVPRQHQEERGARYQP